MLDVSQAFVRPGERIPFRHEETIPPQVIFGETISFPEPAVFEGTYLLEEDSLMLEGSFSARAHGACAYCLTPVVYPVDVPFDEVFLHLNRLTQADPEHLEDEQLTFTGKEVDLTQLALTLALLELPMRLECPACSEEHSAPADGEDTHACQKDTPTVNPFSALQQLLTKDQEV